LHKLWDDKSQCGDMQKEERADHDGNYRGDTTKSKKHRKHLHIHVTPMVSMAIK